MLTTIYKNEQGGIDKVVLTAQNAEESEDLLDFTREKQGYTHGWDKGFAGEGDPYGIQKEYLPQSANPDAATGNKITESTDGKFFTLTGDGKFIGNFSTKEDAEKAAAL